MPRQLAPEPRMPWRTSIHRAGGAPGAVTGECAGTKLDTGERTLEQFRENSVGTARVSERTGAARVSERTAVHRA